MTIRLLIIASCLVLAPSITAQTATVGTQPASAPDTTKRVLEKTDPQSDPAPVPGTKEKKKVGSEAKFARIGFLGQTATGASGLFSVFDGDTLRNKENRFGIQFSRFYRMPGELRITDVPISVNFGFQDFLELFFTANLNRNVKNSSADLSGSILQSVLRLPGNSGASLTNGVSNGFFPLPGFPVSGALVGGVLPGLPIGVATPIADPVLGRNKNAFARPGYFNEFPFVGAGGNSFGGVTFGAKYRFTSLNDYEQDHPTKKPKSKAEEEEAKLATMFSASVLGYVQLPSSRAGNLLRGSNSSLFSGGSGGGTDFGLFLVGSFYSPGPASDAINSGTGENPVRFANTINNHVNLGYIKRVDPKIGNTSLLDRKDSVVIAYGIDSMINPYIQTIGEVRYEKFVGGGTPNVHNASPIDVTVGARIYPLGLLFKDEDQPASESTKSRSRSWFPAIGFAYRHNFAEGGDLNDTVSSRPGFVFQFTFGRDRTNGRLGGRSNPEPEACSAVKDLPVLKQAALNQNVFTKAEKLEARVEVENVFMPLTYSWKLVNAASGQTLDERRTVSENSVSFNLRNLTKGSYRVEVSGTFEYLSLNCPLNAVPPQTFSIVNAKPVIELRPAVTGPISLTVPSTHNLTITASDPDGDQVSVQWQTPPEVVLSGQASDLTRSFSGVAKPGLYKVMVTASDGEDSEQAQADIIVNNPPTVKLEPGDSRINLQHIDIGSLFEVLARGEDPDSRELTYSWRSSGVSSDSRALPPINLDGSSSDPRRKIATQSLEPGVYNISVVASDGLDESAPAELKFTVKNSLILRKPQLFFDTDKFSLKRSERAKLDNEASWLSEEINRTIEIRVEGNADPRASENYNFRLGCKRACSARNYLVRKRGIAPERIGVVISFGEQKARQSRRFYAKDRRVDLIYQRKSDGVKVERSTCGCQVSK
jgi:peptidoglycan-associated lipoprotein